MDSVTALVSSGATAKGTVLPPARNLGACRQWPFRAFRYVDFDRRISLLECSPSWRFRFRLVHECGRPLVLATNFAVSNAPALGRVLLDIAIVLSQNAGFDGKIGLHAAAAGGEALLAMYENCGLTRLPAVATLPQPIHRNNDGRYFYADEVVAEFLAGLLDAHR